MAKNKGKAPTPDVDFTTPAAEGAAAPPPAAEATPAPAVPAIAEGEGGEARQAPAAEEDPVEAAELADFIRDIPEDDLRLMRGLWANGREVGAIRHLRGLRNGPDGQPMSLGESRVWTERIIRAAPPPADFVIPTAEPAPPSLEEQVVHPAEDGWTPGGEGTGGTVVSLPHTAPALKVAPPPSGRRELRRATEDRRFELSQEDFHTKAMALARAHQAVVMEESRQKQVKKDLAAALGKLEEERDKLANEVGENCEIRSVSVIYEADYDEGVVREINEYTGEILRVSSLSGTPDAQVPLFGAGAAAPPAPTPESKAEGDEWPDAHDPDAADAEQSERAEEDAAEGRDEEEGEDGAGSSAPDAGEPNDEE